MKGVNEMNVWIGMDLEWNKETDKFVDSFSFMHPDNSATRQTTGSPVIATKVKLK